MKSAPKQLWHRAEVEESVFSHREIRGWPGGAFERLNRMGLLYEIEFADYVLCDNCTEAHTAEVIWTANVRSPTGMSPIIGCPEVGATDVDLEQPGRGEVIVLRYADDSVVGFEKEGTARAFLADLQERLTKFGLSLHPDKTRLIEFGRYATERRRKRGQGRPELPRDLRTAGRCCCRTTASLRRSSAATASRMRNRPRRSCHLKSRR